MRKTAAATLILICLLSLSAFCLHTTKAQYQGHITISVDGTVSPSSAPILHDGNTYTLTRDVKGDIFIRKSNITFNGNGHMVDLSASSQDQEKACGICLGHVYNVTVANTTVKNTGNGIYAIQQPTAGIYVSYSSSNVIIGNNIENNYNAVSFLESNNNIVTQNNFTNNNNPLVLVGAVMLWGSSNNTIYRNNFIGNKYPAGTAGFDSPSSGNAWDNGKEGNFWDYYNGTDADGNGIGDTPYEFKFESTAHYAPITDRYPLIKPFNRTLYLLKTTPPKIALLSPVNQQFNESSVSLLFTVDKQVSWMGYSLDGQDNITVTGNSTITELINGLHNITVYAKDTFGNEVASETITFAVEVPKPFPTVLIVIATIGLVAGVGAGLLFYFKKRKN
jgi:parallel beta-helix repeat protein